MREERQDQDYIKISKKGIKRIALAAALAGSLAATAANVISDYAKEAYCKNQGAEYIVQEVKDSGILPDNLSAYNDSQAGIIFSYTDIDGNRINVVDSEAFVNDIVVEAIDDKGFSAGEMAVTFDYMFDYSDSELATEEEMEEAKRHAYYELQAQEKGRGM